MGQASLLQPNCSWTVCKGSLPQFSEPLLLSPKADCRTFKQVFQIQWEREAFYSIVIAQEAKMSLITRWSVEAQRDCYLGPGGMGCHGGTDHLWSDVSGENGSLAWWNKGWHWTPRAWKTSGSSELLTFSSSSSYLPTPPTPFPSCSGERTWAASHRWRWYSEPAAPLLPS